MRIAALVAVVGLLVACSTPAERSPSEASGDVPSPAVSLSAAQVRAGLTGAWKSCRNEGGRFEISYPPAWHTLPRELGYNHCRFFDPRPLPPTADPEIAALMVREIGEFDDVLRNLVTDPSWKVVERRDVAVGGRPAVRIETEAVGLDTPFDQGTRFYEYLFDERGQAISVGTVMGPNREELYVVYREVVDRAVGTIRFS